MAINVTRSSMPDYEEYCEEIRELWDSRWLTNMGKKHQALEQALKDYLAVPCLNLFTNGHLALESLLQAMELKGEIITTPYTFASTTHAIVRSGCTPVFCDIDPVDFTMDERQVEALITEKTVAILPVHVYGNLCHHEALATIAKKHGLKLIYDAAHAFGVTKDGVSAASLGDASMFSFHATKVFHTIEGGCIAYADEGLTGRLNRCKNFGITGPEDVDFAGGNAKLNEFCAAMGLCNLRHLEGEIQKRRAAYERYYEHLSPVPGLRLNPIVPGVKHNYAYFPVIFEAYKENRDEVMEKLAAAGIGARKYFYPLTNSFACYRGLPGFEPEKTPVAQRIADQVLTLPLYADLSADEVDRICQIILEEGSVFVSTARKKKAPGLGLCVLVAAVATALGKLHIGSFSLEIIGAPVIAILTGMLITMAAPGLAASPRFQAGVKYTSKKILQYAVILLGFSLNLGTIARMGSQSLPVIVSTISISLLMGYFVGKLLHLDGKVSCLIGVGSSICGGSAVAATAPVIEADDQQVAQAISVIFLFNVLAAFLFPSLGHGIGLGTEGFAIFAGTAVNDTSSVTAVASTAEGLYGVEGILSAAVTVKLVRTLAIIPITLCLALWRAYRAGREGDKGAAFSVKKIFPWFILWFVGASLITTLVGLLPESGFSAFYSGSFVKAMKALSKFFIAMAMCAIGLNTNLVKLVKNGGKPIALGFCCWAAISLVSLAVQLALGIFATNL